MKSRKGFTLIELLVVIAVIGILIALLLPALAATLDGAHEGTVPVLEPLTSENLFVAKDTQMVASSTLGTLTLNNLISAAGAHLDLVYGIDLESTNVLYAVEWVLSTDAPGVMDSDSIYAILSPDGSSMAEKMHTESLYLESYLGNGAGGGDMPMAPEPSAVLLLCVGFLALGCRRSRRAGLVVFCDR